MVLIQSFYRQQGVAWNALTNGIPCECIERQLVQARCGANATRLPTAVPKCGSGGGFNPGPD